VRPIKKAEVPGVKRVNINLEISLHNAFKAATAAQGVDMTTVLQQFIENYVSKHGTTAPRTKGRRA
jgi:predicted DNA binding CopG/RHH family protein